MLLLGKEQENIHFLPNSWPSQQIILFVFAQEMDVHKEKGPKRGRGELFVLGLQPTLLLFWFSLIILINLI